jgi:hypothetical protein
MHHGIALPSGAGGLSGCETGGPTSMERVRYFPRQLITPDDLTQEQEYFRGRMRRHNRLLHGWGVVCGLEVKPTAQDWTVCIEPGYALGPQGDEIVIERAVKIDLSRQGIDGNAASSCVNESDPWCSSVSVDLRGKDAVYVVIAYAQCLSRPVRSQPTGCGCDGTACEYSRIRDGYQVRVLDQLPKAYAGAVPPKDLVSCPETGVVPCPEPVDEPWVVLAQVSVGDKQIDPADIDNRTHRRYLVSFGNAWYQCGPAVDP